MACMAVICQDSCIKDRGTENNDDNKNWEMITHPKRSIAALLNREGVTGEGRRLAN